MVSGSELQGCRGCCMARPAAIMAVSPCGGATHEAGPPWQLLGCTPIGGYAARLLTTATAWAPSLASRAAAQRCQRR